MRKARPCQEKGSILAQYEWINRPHGTTRLPETDHHSTSPKTLKTLVKSIPSHRVVHHVQTSTTSNALYLVQKVSLSVIDHMISAVLPSKRCFFLVANCSDDHRPTDLRNLDKKEASASCSRMNQACL